MLTDLPTNQPTNQPTDRSGYRVAQLIRIGATKKFRPDCSQTAERRLLRCLERECVVTQEIIGQTGGSCPHQAK